MWLHVIAQIVVSKKFSVNVFLNREKEMATNSSILAWAEEAGGLWSIGSQRFRHDKQFSIHACFE